MSSPTGILKVLSNGQGEGDSDIDVLLISGVGTPSVDTWVFSSPKYLSNLLPQNLKHARVLAFDYTTSLNENRFSCQDFLVQGDVLLNALLELRSKQDIDFRPILGICHSVGGLILKQALCIANEQPFRYGSVLSSVAGLIFFGTPHMGTTDEETLSRLLAILAGTGNLKRPIHLPEQRLRQERAMLSQLAARFEGINIQVPVLSISGSKKSKIYGGLLKSKNLLLTDSSLCTIKSPAEKALTFPLEHAALCHVELVDQDKRQQLDQFLQESMTAAETVVTARLEALDFKHATTSTYSPVESEFHIVSEEVTSAGAGDLTKIATQGSSDQGFEMIPHLQSSVQRNTTVNLPCIMLESHDPGRIFFGQQQILESIQKVLVPSAKGKKAQPELRQFALCALGGMGKTEISTEFALRNQHAFDAVFWVRADEPAKLDESYHDISVQLGLETAKEATDHIVSRSLVKGWLANPVKEGSDNGEDLSSSTSENNIASWLLIFDNADDPKLLGDYWPEGSGSVLITSRDPLAKRLFSPRTSGIDLEPLNEVDGGALMLKLTESDESPEEDAEAIARKVSKSLAGLPLAIAQMAGIIRRQELSLSEFLSIYEEREHRASLYCTKYNTSTRSYQYSIATVWAFEKLSHEAKGLLKLAFFLDPDSIPETILFDAAALMYNKASFSRTKFNETRADLLQSSLIKRDKRKNELSDYSISVHRLVQDAIGADMSDDERASIFEILIDLLWEMWPSSMPSPTKPSTLLRKTSTDKRWNISKHPLCALLYPHVLHLKQVWPSIARCTDNAKIRFAALLNDAAWYQHERGRFRGFDGFWDLAQTLCESVLGDDSESVLSSVHCCLGMVYLVTNDRESARKHNELFLTLQKSMCESIGPDFVDKRLGLAYTNMAVSYTQYDELNEAVEAYKREMDMRIELRIDKGLLSRDANYAHTLMLRGDLDTTEKLLVGCEELWKLTGSEVSQRIAKIFHAFGDLRNRQGRHDEAYDYHQKALYMYIESTGLQSRRAAEMRHKLAEHFIRMQRYEEAVAMINAALLAWNYNAEIFKPELARTTWMKARLLERLGKTQKASVAFKVAGRLRNEIVPDDTRDVKSLEAGDFDCLLAFFSR